MSINRIMIDAPTGLIEIEGEKDFVEAQLDKILPLIEGCGFGQSVKPSEDDTSQASPNSKEVAPPVASDANGGKKTKRAIDRPPKGHSCADRILELRKDGFFKDQKTPAQIAEGLGKKGWTHTPNQVSAAAGQMFKRGEIQRTSVDKGFAYYWDRD